jgi:hypothetical protein
MDKYRPWRIAAAYALFLLAVAAVATVAYEAVTAPFQPELLRLAAVLVLSVVLLHIRARLHALLHFRSRTPFDRALRAPPRPPAIAPIFLKRRDEIANACTSRPYFDRILWPHLRELAASKGLKSLPAPPARRLFGRGPSLQAISDILSQIEQQP